MRPVIIALFLASGPAIRQSGPGNAITFPIGANPSFQLFPASGIGTSGGECSGNIPTGINGEIVTFTRAGGQTCTRANGNVVKLTANQPVVETLTGMALSDGNSLISGPMLGMLDEPAATNSTIQSEAFDNVAWGKFASVVAVPTVTADAAFAPDGNLTAERVQIPATTAAQFSIIQQSSACPISAATASFYVKGNGTSGTLPFNLQNPFLCGSCVYNSSTWTRCNISETITSGGSFTIGNDSADSCASGAQDVFIWGGQCEGNQVPSSYIPTTTVAVARSATAWSVDTSTFTPSVTSAIGCAGADAYSSKTYASASVGPLQAGLMGGGGRICLDWFNASLQVAAFDGTNSSTGTTVTMSQLDGVLRSCSTFWSNAGGHFNTFTSFGLNTQSAAYANNFLGAAGAAAVIPLGHSTAGGVQAIPVWLTRIRLDTDGTGAKCR